MITYSRKGNRHTFGMNKDDLDDFAELMWLLKHTPPPLGFHRKPLTLAQQRIVDAFSSLITYPPDYAGIVNAKTGQ